MLPTLEEFGIVAPVFIRKIDSSGRWNPEGCVSLEDRAKRVSDSIFKEEICSIWKVTSNEEFYGVIASLSARRNPRHQDIHFIWIAEDELQESGITIHCEPEGECLYVQKLHFNAKIDRSITQKLCHSLLEKGRQSKCCRKKKTVAILEYQRTKKCRAIDINFPNCDCEVNNHL